MSHLYLDVNLHAWQFHLEPGKIFVRGAPHVLLPEDDLSVMLVEAAIAQSPRCDSSMAFAHTPCSREDKGTIRLRRFGMIFGVRGSVRSRFVVDLWYFLAIDFVYGVSCFANS